MLPGTAPAPGEDYADEYGCYPGIISLTETMLPDSGGKHGVCLFRLLRRRGQWPQSGISGKIRVNP